MSGNSVDILVVEDDPEDLELTLRALRRENICNDIQVAQVKVGSTLRLR